jgi:PAS domain S-box-containing protein
MATHQQHSSSGRQVPVSENGHGEIADLLGDMVSAHAPDGTFRYVSEASKELLGYDPSELVGSASSEHLHPEDVARVETAHRSALHGVPYTLSYRLRGKAGEYVLVETTTRVVRDKNGDVEQIVCSTRPLEGRRAREGVTEEHLDLWQRRIQDVLERQAIEIVFQPVLELPSCRPVAYEALSRFPGDPSLTPDRWFSEAWEVGLGLPLELLAVRKAAGALDRIPEDVGLSVNASPPVVSTESFLAAFEGSRSTCGSRTTAASPPPLNQFVAREGRSPSTISEPGTPACITCCACAPSG